MIETFILKTDTYIEKKDFIRLLSYVSEAKKERINRYYRYEDAQRTLIGDLISRYAICKKLNISNNDLAFRFNKYGKPELVEHKNVHFNISHSGSWVVCAIDNDPIGIDVEIIKPTDFKIAERFFAKDEFALISNQSDEMKLQLFYKIWTLKESYIKSKGRGMSIHLNSFSIKFHESNIQAFIGDKPTGHYFHQRFLDKDAIIAICSLNNKPVNIMHIDIKQFLLELNELKLDYK